MCVRLSDMLQEIIEKLTNHVHGENMYNNSGKDGELNDEYSMACLMLLTKR